MQSLSEKFDDFCNRFEVFCLHLDELSERAKIFNNDHVLDSYQDDDYDDIDYSEENEYEAHL